MDNPNYDDINFLDIVSIINLVTSEGESLARLGGTDEDNLLAVIEMREPLKEAVLSFVLQRVVGLWEAASRTTTRIVRRAVSRAAIVTARAAKLRAQAVYDVVMEALEKTNTERASAVETVRAERAAAMAHLHVRRVEELRQEAMAAQGARATTAMRVYNNARVAAAAWEADPTSIFLLQTANVSTMVAMILLEAVKEVILEIDRIEERLPDFIRTAPPFGRANVPSRAMMRDRLRAVETMRAAAAELAATRSERPNSIWADALRPDTLESERDDEFVDFGVPARRPPAEENETTRKKAALAAAREAVALLRAAEMTALYKKYEEVCIDNSIPIELIPDDFICPLSLAIMKYPVHRVNTNFTYERYWIMKWLLDNNTEPQTREIVNASAYVINVEIKTRIDEFIARITDTINKYKDKAGRPRNKSRKIRKPKQTKRRQLKSKHSKNKYTKNK